MQLSLSNIQKMLLSDDPAATEALAQKAQKITQQYFGRTISLYAPLYLSNHCSSQCVYCGFRQNNPIARFKLDADQMQREMAYLAQKSIKNILLLTGESYSATPLSYLLEAVEIAKDNFAAIALEIHPLEEHEYAALFQAGVDGLTIYQETYDRDRYKQLHIAGKKQDYDFRRNTAARAALAGIRNISLGILLGLHDVCEDLFSLYTHLQEMEQNFPGVEYSLSFPRLQPIKGTEFAHSFVDDATFIKIICLTRILFPRVGINLSTRENAQLRDHAIELGVTRISAESNTRVGGYTLKTSDINNPQFDVQDDRSIETIIKTLKAKNFDPVLTDWQRMSNPKQRNHEE